VKVLYIAKHDSGGNDDEGAIAHALEELGCTVVRVPENAPHEALHAEADFALFHKWEDSSTLAKLSMPKVFWYFDLVESHDRLLTRRDDARRNWMLRTMPLVDVGFCTDGDWVCKHPEKLRHLMQGADARIAGRDKQTLVKPQVLFTGTSSGGGTGRQMFVQAMRFQYRGAFHHVARGAYGKPLRKLIASYAVCVAPNSPVTNVYWSNRVYNALGFGAFLLHPRCDGLKAHYTDGIDLRMYSSMEELYSLIAEYMSDSSARNKIAQAGYEHTMKFHTYRHRCEQLLEEIKCLNLC
jgi:hypothetical protein